MSCFVMASCFQNLHLSDIVNTAHKKVQWLFSGTSSMSMDPYFPIHNDVTLSTVRLAIQCQKGKTLVLQGFLFLLEMLLYHFSLNPECISCTWYHWHASKFQFLFRHWKWLTFSDTRVQIDFLNSEKSDCGVGTAMLWVKMSIY